jgi:hypothetical protein
LVLLPDRDGARFDYGGVDDGVFFVGVEVDFGCCTTGGETEECDLFWVLTGMSVNGTGYGRASDGVTYAPEGCYVIADPFDCASCIVESRVGFVSED